MILGPSQALRNSRQSGIAVGYGSSKGDREFGKLGRPALPDWYRRSAPFPAGSVMWALPPPSSARTDQSQIEGMIIGLDTGVYHFDNGEWLKLGGISEALSGQPAGFAADVGTDEFVVGTLNNGVVLSHRDGSVVSVVNHNNGLTDDSVCSLWGDRRGAIWVGLNDGCARLDSLGIISIFDRREGLEIGLPRRVLSSGGSTYVLTDRMLYRLSNGLMGSHLEKILEGSPRFSDAFSKNDAIWLSGSDGLKTLGSDFPAVTKKETGVLTQAPWSPDGLLFSEGHDLMWSSGSSTPSWQDSPLQSTTRLLPYSIATTADGNIWESADGIYELRISTSNGARVATPIAHFTEGAGLPLPSAHPVLTISGSRYMP